jgi:hypothetical protein
VPLVGGEQRVEAREPGCRCRGVGHRHGTTQSAVGFPSATLDLSELIIDTVIPRGIIRPCR